MREALVDKLRAMAHADESPFEAEIAAAKLAEAGVPVDPPRPPAPPAAAPVPFGRWSFSTTGTTNTTTTGTTNTTTTGTTNTTTTAGGSSHTIWVRFG